MPLASLPTTNAFWKSGYSYVAQIGTSRSFLFFFKFEASLQLVLVREFKLQLTSSEASCTEFQRELVEFVTPVRRRAPYPAIAHIDAWSDCLNPVIGSDSHEDKIILFWIIFWYEIPWSFKSFSVASWQAMPPSLNANGTMYQMHSPGPIFQLFEARGSPDVLEFWRQLLQLRQR
ncbi:unnamed protein product [Caenorhabditis nigoni]